MLNNVTIYEVTVLRAVGQHEVFEAQFVSTEILSGNTLNVDLGLFLPNMIDTSSGSAWTTTYPSTPGTYDMIFQGIQSAQNIHVELQVIDGLSFIIRAHFILRADTGKFVSQGGANNPGSFTQLHYAGLESLYEAPKWFAIRCEHEGDVGIHWRPIGANHYEQPSLNPLTYTLKISGAETTGYVVGQDLTVEFELEGCCIAADYDVAVIKVDDIATGGDFVTAHSLNYGRVTDNVAAVETIPSAALKDGTPIGYLVPNFGNGTFTIDGSYFEADSVYRFYLVYRNLGLSLPAISADIESSNLDADFPVTFGDITCTVSEQDCTSIEWSTTVSATDAGGPNPITVWTAQITFPFGFSPINTVFANSQANEGALTSSGDSFAIWGYDQDGGGNNPGDHVIFTVTLDDGSEYTIQVPLDGSLQNSGTIESCDETTLFETCCIEGFCPGNDIRLCTSMDQAGYNADVVTNGVTGTYESNLVAITAGVVSEAPTMAPVQFDSALTVDDSGCVDLTVPDEWANTTKYIVFVYHFDLGTHQDFIYRVFRLGVGSANANIQVSEIRDVDNNILTVLCNEIAGNLFVHLAGDFSDCNLIVEIGEENTDNFSSGPIVGIVLNGNSAIVEIDTSQLSESLTYCLRISCSDDPIDPDEDDCTCFDLDLTQTTVTAGTQASMTIDFVVPADVDSIEITTSTGSAGIFAGSAQLAFSAPAPGSNIAVIYNITITKGGCIFQTQLTMVTCNVDADTTNVNYNICNPPPEAACNNVIGILTGCDPSGGLGLQEIIANTSLSGATNIDTTTFESSQDGLTNWTTYVGGTPIIGFPNYFFRLIVTFTDGCKNLTAFEHVECITNGILTCLNEPLISECLFDAVAETLVLEDIGTYNSVVSDPVFDFSIDAGTTWTTISGPISTTGFVDGQVILARLNPIYQDGCPQGPEFIRECIFNEGVTTCDYTQFTLACGFDNEVFTGTFTGDTSGLLVNLQEFSENGGASWELWTDIPVSSAAQTVIFRWTLQYTGCETETLISACTKPCSLLEFPTDINVNITNEDLSVAIDGCVSVMDCLDCTITGDDVDAGTDGTAEVCDADGNPKT